VPRDFEELRSTIIAMEQEKGYVPSSEWIEKAMQLYRFQQIHHGIMLVGNSGTGKTSSCRALLDALQKMEGVESACHLLDAKVMSKEALYGALDPTTREWTDGIFTGILRKIVENLRGEDKKRHWIVFNGDVDPEWVENLNSVLDDNKILTLPNGERIAVPPNVRIIFEVENLQYATPATVTRCGMIWFGSNIITPAMELSYHIHRLREASFDDSEDDILASDLKLEDTKLTVADCVAEILQRLTIQEVIDESLKLSHVMEVAATRILGTLFSLIKSTCLKLHRFTCENIDFPPTIEQKRRYVTRSVLQSFLWAFAGDCPLQDRERFGMYLLSLGPFVDVAPSNGEHLIDLRASFEDGWTQWTSVVPYVDLETHSIAATDVVVPTVDTVRHESLIYGLLNDHKPVILCGPPGSGKTMTLFSALRKSPNLDVIGLNFSKATTPGLLIKSLEQHCEYKKTINGTVLSPSQIGRWLVVFCDEINLPATDKYGTQRVISLLRQMIEERGFWKEDEKKWVSLSHIQFVGACNPPRDAGRNPLNLRFLRHCAVALVDYPGETSLHQIYHSFISAILTCVPSLKGYADDLTKAMIELYLDSQKKFTAEKSPHYIYSPRELTRWCRGIYEAIKPLEELSIEGLVRIWAHEALRLFHDRLMRDDERAWTKNLVRQVASKFFLNADLNRALKSPILYSNWLSKHYLPVERVELKRYIEARMKTFCEEELDKPMILFNDLLDHVLRIDRVLRQPQGHLILIGISSSGKVCIDGGL
jgi:dynein heavy chain 1